MNCSDWEVYGSIWRLTLYQLTFLLAVWMVAWLVIKIWKRRRARLGCSAKEALAEPPAGTQESE